MSSESKDDHVLRQWFTGRRRKERESPPDRLAVFGFELCKDVRDLSAATERKLAKRLPTTEKLDAWYTSVEEMETGLASGAMVRLARPKNSSRARAK